jgi:hypothetical protein
MLLGSSAMVVQVQSQYSVLGFFHPFHNPAKQNSVPSFRWIEYGCFALRARFHS